MTWNQSVSFWCTSWRGLYPGRVSQQKIKMINTVKSKKKRLQLLLNHWLEGILKNSINICRIAETLNLKRNQTIVILENYSRIWCIAMGMNVIINTIGLFLKTVANYLKKTATILHNHNLLMRQEIIYNNNSKLEQLLQMAIKDNRQLIWLITEWTRQDSKWTMWKRGKKTEWWWVIKSSVVVATTKMV